MRRNNRKPSGAKLKMLEGEQVGGEHVVGGALGDGVGGAEAVEGVGGLQEREGLVEDQALQGPDHGHHVGEGEAMVGAPGFQQGLHQCGRLVLQDADLMNLGDLRLVGVWVQALDQPAVLLHEIAVHQVAHGAGRQAAHVVLGQRLEGLPHERLDAGAALAAVQAEHGLEGLLQAGLDLLQRHCAGLTGLAAAAEAAGGSHGAGQQGQASNDDGLAKHLEERRVANVELTRSHNDRDREAC